MRELTWAERKVLELILRKPEVLDRLIQSLQEEPKPWVDDDFIPCGEIEVPDDDPTIP